MPTSRYLRTPLLFGLLALLLAGCGRPRASAPSPTPSPSSATFPVTLTDALGQTVTLPRQPARIISIAPTVTEMLFAIGAEKQLVADTEQCNYPAPAKRLPKIGQWWQPSAERALALEPDLVLAQRGNTPDSILTLRKSGIPVFAIDPKSIAGIQTALRHLGQLSGQRAGAERVVTQMQAHLRTLHERVAGVPEAQRPTAFIIVQVAPVWTAGAGTFQDEAIRAAGARNVGASVQDFKEFSLEKLAAADPDWLLVTTMAGNPEQMRRDVVANPALQRLTAVKKGRVLLLNADEIDRPGPRLVKAIEMMEKAFYPEAAGSEKKTAR